MLKLRNRPTVRPMWCVVCGEELYQTWRVDPISSRHVEVGWCPGCLRSRLGWRGLRVLRRAPHNTTFGMATTLYSSIG